MGDLLSAQRRIFTLDLKPTEKLVALAILNHWSRNRATYPSVPRLALWTGLSERTVQTCLAGLQQAGAIGVKRQVGTSNTYDLSPLFSADSNKTPAGAAP